MSKTFIGMHLKELKNHVHILQKEVDTLPKVYIRDEPRKEGEWVGSEYLKKVVSLYSEGKYGWLKGGQDHVQESWISWPLIWGGNFITSNCNLCPETYKLLSKIDGIHVAGFSLMKGGVTLNEHVDFIGDEYLFTYHLGIKCPEKCILHHAEMGDITEENGKHIIMNARKPHWAENQSSEDRIILYMEMYKTD
jgi:hypothetical protein